MDVDVVEECQNYPYIHKKIESRMEMNDENNVIAGDDALPMALEEVESSRKRPRSPYVDSCGSLVVTTATIEEVEQDNRGVSNEVMGCNFVAELDMVLPQPTPVVPDVTTPAVAMSEPSLPDSSEANVISSTNFPMLGSRPVSMSIPPAPTLVPISNLDPCNQCFCYHCNAAITRCKDWSNHCNEMATNSLWLSRHRATRTLSLHMLSSYQRERYLWLNRTVLPLSSSNRRYSIENKDDFHNALLRINRLILERSEEVEVLAALLLSAMELSTKETLPLVIDAFIDLVLLPELNGKPIATYLQQSVNNSRFKCLHEIWAFINALSNVNPLHQKVQDEQSGDDLHHHGMKCLSVNVALILHRLAPQDMLSWLSSVPSPAILLAIFVSSVDDNEDNYTKHLKPIIMLWKALPTDREVLESLLSQQELTASTLLRCCIFIVNHVLVDDIMDQGGNRYNRAVAFFGKLIRSHLTAQTQQGETPEEIAYLFRLTDSLNGFFSLCCHHTNKVSYAWLTNIQAKLQASGMDSITAVRKAGMSGTLGLTRIALVKCMRGDFASVFVIALLRELDAPSITVLVQYLSLPRVLENARKWEYLVQLIVQWRRTMFKSSESPSILPMPSISTVEKKISRIPMLCTSSSLNGYLISEMDLSCKISILATEEPIVVAVMRGHDYLQLQKQTFSSTSSEFGQIMGAVLPPDDLPRALRILVEELQLVESPFESPAWCTHQSTRWVAVWKAILAYILYPSAHRPVVYYQCHVLLQNAKLSVQRWDEWIEASSSTAFVNECGIFYAVVMHTMATIALVDIRAVDFSQEKSRGLDAALDRLQRLAEDHPEWTAVIQSLHGLPLSLTDSAPFVVNTTDTIKSLQQLWRKIAHETLMKIMYPVGDEGHPFIKLLLGPTWPLSQPLVQLLTDDSTYEDVIKHLARTHLNPLFDAHSIHGRLLDVGSALTKHQLPAKSPRWWTLTHALNEIIALDGAALSSNLLYIVVTKMGLSNLIQLAHCWRPLICFCLGAIHKPLPSRQMATEALSIICSKTRRKINNCAVQNLRTLGLTMVIVKEFQAFIDRWTSVHECLEEVVGSNNLVDLLKYVQQLIFFCPDNTLLVLSRCLRPFFQQVYCTTVALPQDFIRSLSNRSSTNSCFADLLVYHFFKAEHCSSALQTGHRMNVLSWLMTLGQKGEKDMHIPLERRGLSWSLYWSLLSMVATAPAINARMLMYHQEHYISGAIVTDLAGFVDGLLCCLSKTPNAPINLELVQLILRLIVDCLLREPYLQVQAASSMLGIIRKEWVERDVVQDSGAKKRAKGGKSLLEMAELEEAKDMLRRLLWPDV